MSLINDMLRELDQRGAAVPLPAGAAPARRSRRRRPGLVIALLAALLLLPALAWLLVQRLPTPPAADSAGAGIETPMPGSADAVAAEPLATVAPVSVVEPAAPSSPLPADPAADPPSSDWQQVLIAAPPIAGSARRPVSVEPAPVDPEPVQPVPAPSRPEPITPTTAARPRAPVPATRPVASIDPTADIAPPTAEPGSPSERPSRLSIQRRPDSDASPDTVANELIHQAQTELTAGRSDAALHLLQLALARVPTHHRARLMLADLHSGLGRVDAAIGVLDAGLALDPQHPLLAERLGRLLLQQGDPLRAATVLATALPPLAEQPGHHALLALAWQQAGQPAQAARRYDALLGHDPQVGAWWLGLALARDGLGDTAAARDAFRQAERVGGLDGGVLRYVRQRIHELEGSPR
jgi:MSHA biogenesis protein MshN